MSDILNIRVALLCSLCKWIKKMSCLNSDAGWLNGACHSKAANSSFFTILLYIYWQQCLSVSAAKITWHFNKETKQNISNEALILSWSYLSKDWELVEANLCLPPKVYTLVGISMIAPFLVAAQIQASLQILLLSMLLLNF